MEVIIDRPDLREKESEAFAALPQDLQTEIVKYHHAGVLKKRYLCLLSSWANSGAVLHVAHANYYPNTIT